MMIMNPEHEKWNEFIERLEGPEGCNFMQRDPNDRTTVTWKCKGNHSSAISILETIPDIDIDGSIEFFENHGGYCDCEILFNVA